MGLETVSYISDLVATNPPNTDPKSQGAAHLRNIKVGLLNSFPLIAGPVSASHEDLSAISSINPGTLPAVNGSNVTNLNASALASGTVPDARLSSNVPLKNASNEYTGALQEFTNASVAMRWDDTDASTNQRLTLLAFNNGLSITSRTDANGAGATLLSASRSGTTWSSLALAATTITLNGVNVTDYARLSQANTFTSSQMVSSTQPQYVLRETDGGADEKVTMLRMNGGTVFISSATDAAPYSAVTNLFSAARSGTNWASLNLQADSVLYGGIEVGYRGLPTWSSGDQNGKVRELTSSIQLNTGGTPGAVNVYYNNSDSAVNLNQGSGLTLRLGGTTVTGNRTILPRGFATLWVRGSTEYIVTGHVT